jgi:hypothetical protein
MPFIVPPNLQKFLTLGVSIFCLAFIIYGINGIATKRINVGWRYVPSEKHIGTSAVIWGVIYISVGIVFLLSYIVIQTDMLYTQKFDLSRLF